MMKKLMLILAFSGVLLSCSSDDDNTNQTENSSCNGATCAATLGTDETMATVPASAFGTYACEYTFADANSPFQLGDLGTFTLTADQTFVVDIEGFDCITLSNPIWRFGADASSGNYTFKDNCRDDIAYNVSFNSDGSFNEVNIEVVDGPGFFGQFTLQ